MAVNQSIQITTPTVRVNGEVIPIVPNTFSYQKGFGERTVNVASAGGSNSTVVIAENAESQKSTCKFSIYATAQMLETLDIWQVNLNENTIDTTDSRTGFNVAFQQMTVTNEPERNLAEGQTIEVQWEGLRAI